MYTRLKKSLGENLPTSGAHLIYLALLSRAKKIDVYGFDFYKTFSFYEQRTDPVPHDFDTEEEWAQELVRNKKITIHGNDNKTYKRVIPKRNSK
jgi:hypothetical protein